MQKLTLEPIIIPIVCATECLDYSHIIERHMAIRSASTTTTILPPLGLNSTEEESEEEEVEPIKMKSFPHLAKIALGPRDNMRFKCTGTIISPRFILTSAVCTESPT